jgi:hypothetical protein
MRDGELLSQCSLVQRQPPKGDEGSDDIDAHLDRSSAIQHVSRLDCAVLGEDKRQMPQTRIYILGTKCGKMHRMKTTVLPQLPEQLLTRAQVAALFGVTKHTIRMFERRGLISALRINARLLRYRACDIRKLLDNSQS